MRRLPACSSARGEDVRGPGEPRDQSSLGGATLTGAEAAPPKYFCSPAP